MLVFVIIIVNVLYLAKPSALSIILILFASCASLPETINDKPAPSKESALSTPALLPDDADPVTLTIWTQDENSQRLLSTLAEDFMDKGPEVSISVIQKSNNTIVGDYESAFHSGTAPQLILSANDHSGILAAQEMLYPTEDLYDWE